MRKTCIPRERQSAGNQVEGAPWLVRREKTGWEYLGVSHFSPAARTCRRCGNGYAAQQRCGGDVGEGLRGSPPWDRIPEASFDG